MNIPQTLKNIENWRRILLFLSICATTYEFYRLIQELNDNNGQLKTVFTMAYFAWLSLMLKTGTMER
jgi:hypothetical protein